MKNYLTPLQTALINSDLPMLGISVNFLEKNSSFADLNIPSDLDQLSKFLHHEHGFRRFISDVKVDVSPSIRLSYNYDTNLDYTESYYTFVEDFLKDHKLINIEDSIKNYDPIFFNDMYQQLEFSNPDITDCRSFLNIESYTSFLAKANRELYNKNYINIPGIADKTNLQNVKKQFQTMAAESPWNGPKINTNPSVKYVMKKEYAEKSITYLLLLALYNYINNIELPDYVRIISECKPETPQNNSNDPWWENSPNNFLNNFRKSSNSLYSDVTEGFGSDVFEDYRTNNDFVPKSFRAVFLIRIPYDSIQTVQNFDANILNNQIINMNPLKPSISNFTKKINYTRQ
jgi:hypothetical protein